MANSYYQTPTIPRLYTSYPLWQYANGALDDAYNYQEYWTQEDLIRMIQLDPSNITYGNPDPDGTYTGLKYRLLPSGQTADMTKIYNFNYLMVLGHNFASANARIKLHADNDEGHVDDSIGTSNLVNYSNWNEIEYDGWSLASIDEIAPSDAYYLRLGISAVDSQDGGTYNELPIQIGSLLWGRYFDFPINCSLNTQTKFDYGVKQKQTLSGKTVSTANWTKPSNWITEPFGLSEPFTGRGDNFQRRSGRRTWKISFDSIAPDKVMNQNPMLNSFGWKPQDNHATGSGLDGNESLYDINYALDFYTNVVNKTMGGHLPMVLQLNKDVFSPESFAIVRMQKDYTITQKSPNLYSVSLTLVEQI